MSLSEEQKELLLQIVQTNIKKTEWVVENKKLEEKKKKQLEEKVHKMKEIAQILET